MRERLHAILSDNSAKLIAKRIKGYEHPIIVRADPTSEADTAGALSAIWGPEAAALPGTPQPDASGSPDLPDTLPALAEA